MSDPKNKKEKKPFPICLIIPLLIIPIILIYNIKNNLFWTNENIAIILIILGIFIFLATYYESLLPNKWKWTLGFKLKTYQNNDKKETSNKLYFGIGSSLLISGLLEIIALPLNHDWYLILLRIVLLVITTFIALFMADAINKS